MGTPVSFLTSAVLSLFLVRMFLALGFSCSALKMVSYSSNPTLSYIYHAGMSKTFSESFEMITWFFVLFICLFLSFKSGSILNRQLQDLDSVLFTVG